MWIHWSMLGSELETFNVRHIASNYDKKISYCWCKKSGKPVDMAIIKVICKVFGSISSVFGDFFYQQQYILSHMFFGESWNPGTTCQSCHGMEVDKRDMLAQMYTLFQRTLFRSHVKLQGFKPDDFWVVNFASPQPTTNTTKHKKKMLEGFLKQTFAVCFTLNQLNP